MRMPVQETSRGIAWSNSESVLTRSISLFCLVLFALAIPDLWPSISREPLSAFTLCFAGIFVTLLGSLLADRAKYGFAAVAAVLLFVSFVAWQYGLIGAHTLEEARPWSWGYAGAGIGIAAVAWRFRPTITYGLAFAVLLMAVPLFPSGSMRTWNQSWQDALLTAVMAIAIAAPVEALRRASSAADTAAVNALESFGELARTKELRAERARLDALTHDAILSTLIVAAQAHDEEVLEAVREVARDAVNQLDGFRYDHWPAPHARIPLADLVLMLRSATATHKVPVSAPDFGSASTVRVPARTAEAVVQATLEAIRNSLRHGSLACPKVEVVVDPSVPGKSEVWVKIIDEGPGFKPDSIPPERLGVTESIIGRMKTAYGEAHIDSSPGVGTTVTLHWSQTEADNG